MLHLYDDIDARLALAAYLKQKRKNAKMLSCHAERWLKNP